MAGVWIDVDLDAIVSNFREVLRLLSPSSRCMAVVKADAYGLGAAEVARALQEAGCEAFAVTHVEEGMILRRNGIEGTILVLGPTSPEEWPAAIEGNLQLTLSYLAQVSDLEDACRVIGRTVEVHIKLETGMGRTGFILTELEELAALLHKAPHIKVAGIYTHFARAAQRDRKYTEAQYSAFMDGVAALAKMGIEPNWKHVCNSAAFLDYPQWHHDFVRIGTLLIGHYPAGAFQGKLALRDPWTAKSRVLYVRKVPKGTFVGYQSIYRTKAETQLVVIGAGYADGFGVEPHLIPQGWWDLLKITIKNTAALFGFTLGKERVLLKGRSVRVAGKIGMQLTVLDVGLSECAPGDEVTIPLRRTLANPLIPRRYWRDGRIYSVRTLNEEGVLWGKTEYSKY